MEDDNAEYLDEYFLIGEVEEPKAIIFEQETNKPITMSPKYAISKPIPKKKTKEKASKPKTTKPKKPKSKPVKINDEITLYAYKYCLGLYDSLIANSDMPLWYRDGDFLLQKFLRHSQDENGLVYEGTRIYSSWTDEQAQNYVEVKAIVTEAKNYSSSLIHIAKVKVFNNVLIQIENLCAEENFGSLNLPPYPYKDKSDTENNNDSMDSASIKIEEITVDYQEMNPIDEYI
ncbi:hypothetical protein PVAND_006558 [Polypedilum vanderplanki]|uniref:Uncharacterized protein n=1 Tax=Polypedilum vanderplanki TaxID=319348 RepID=A0A9J6C4B4_POLVA|nr:hypothetical protein PVAND_006558 [Polypedilum vanderplanki]